jgi:hypothetical protein
MTTARNCHPPHTTRPRQRPGTSHHTVPSPGRPRAARLQADRQRQARRRRAIGWLSAAVLVLAGVITVAMLGTGPSLLQSSTARPAPGFTLTATT